MKHRITAFLAAGAFFMAGTEVVRAQRIMENLDRGTLAIRVNNGIYVNWRLPATEWGARAHCPLWHSLEIPLLF